MTVQELCYVKAMQGIQGQDMQLTHSRAPLLTTPRNMSHFRWFAIPMQAVGMPMLKATSLCVSLPSCIMQTGSVTIQCIPESFTAMPMTTKHLGVPEEVKLPFEVGQLPLQVRLSFHSSFCSAALILHCLGHCLLPHTTGEH